METTTTIKDLQLALGIDLNKTTGQKLTSATLARLNYLGLATHCSRCAGTGRHSFNGSHSICYRCNGVKVDMPTEAQIDTAMIEETTRLVAAGALEPYFKANRDSISARKAIDLAMKQWTDTGISERYNWRSDEVKDREYMDINRPIAESYQAVSDAYWHWKDPRETSGPRKGYKIENPDMAALTAGLVELQKKHIEICEAAKVAIAALDAKYGMVAA